MKAHKRPAKTAGLLCCWWYQNKRGEMYIRACIYVMILCTVFILMFNYILTIIVAKEQRQSAEQILDQYTQLNSIEIHNSIKMQHAQTVKLRYRCAEAGRLELGVIEGKPSLCSISVPPSDRWEEWEIPAELPDGVQALFVRYHGKQTLEIESIAIF